MAYIEVYDVTRASTQHFVVWYNILADDGTTLEAASSLSVPFIDKSQGTAAQRRTQYRQQLTTNWDQAIIRAESGKDEFDAIKAALIGFRYPAAP